MSTKTTIKRIALVAVAALGLGVLSVAPSSAAPRATYGTMYDSTNGVAIVGAPATVTFTLETSTTNTFSWSGVGTVNYAQAATGVVGNGYGVGTATLAPYTSGTLGTDGTDIAGNSVSGTRYAAAPGSGTTVVTTNAAAGGTVTFGLASTAAGTQTITLNHVDSNGVPGTPVTKSVTWVAGAYTANAGYSTSYLGTASASTAVDATAAAAFKPYAAKTAGAVAAQISTNIKSDVNANLNGVAITYAITSGPGLLSAINVNDDSTSDATAVGRSLSKTATEMATTNKSGISIIGDGTGGT